jgi:beta-aspartyl-peptidase (threonine type)
VPLTVGTAGHIDHGKTWLVRALTGKDTDRLPEEKERGISIDLGYAPLELPDGRRLSLVDVPGHERFVRNMVAGATGIDLFLLVIDAAEGARPQTHEHLAIMRLLGIEHGVVAVAKADAVDEETLELALDEARELVPGAHVVAVSAKTGAGLEELRAAMRAAAAAGWARLSEGGTSLDAVEAAVRLLEDHPRFNAGRGAVLTAAGTVELDASIMEGDRLRCGAVAAVSGIANPISLARRVLEDGRHVLLVAGGARAFARAHGIPECDPESLITDRQRQRWIERRGSAGSAQATAAHPERAPDVPRGTVGAVALDARGTMAAATSTGGTAGQLPGRVGDSALIGCGTYAESTIGGASCTGTGEAIIRTVLAYRALAFLKDADDPDYAAKVAVDALVVVSTPPSLTRT